jgi:hypothetical protein
MLIKHLGILLLAMALTLSISTGHTQAGPIDPYEEPTVSGPIDPYE